MIVSKSTPAQKAASQKYRMKNKDKERVQSYKRTTRLFLKSHSTIGDLEEMEQIIAERKIELAENDEK